MAWVEGGWLQTESSQRASALALGLGLGLDLGLGLGLGLGPDGHKNTKT